jgi:hypothetical protein
MPLEPDLLLSSRLEARLRVLGEASLVESADFRGRGPGPGLWVMPVSLPRS